MLAEKRRERELEDEQAQVAAQLIELQKGRIDLEQALGLSFDDAVTVEASQNGWD